MRVLVTGAAGHLGRVLLPHLLADPAIGAVVGLDRAASPATHPRLTMLAGDLLGPDLPRALAGVDAVIHLAFILNRRAAGLDRATMRRINVDGAERLARLAALAGVRRLVFASSVAVYGTPTPPGTPIAETAPIAPLPGFAYAQDKAAAEAALAGSGDKMELSLLRLHAVVGPQAQPLVNALAQAWLLPRPTHPATARLQCVWEEDAARALHRALAGPPGIYNIAAPGPLPWPRFLARLARPGRPARSLPAPLLDHLHHLLAPFTARLGDPGWIAGFADPPVMDLSRAARLLGWRAAFSVAGCLAALTPGADDPAVAA